MGSVNEELHQGAWIITPNNRLASTLIDEFFHSQGSLVQEKPPCLPYETFLIGLFNQETQTPRQQNRPVLLTPSQLHYLWSDVIGDGASSGLIAQAEEAWSRCLRWQLPFSHPEFSLTSQSQQLQHWAEAVQQRLESLGAIARDQLVEYLIHTPLYLPASRYVWYCFDDFSPQQKSLQTYLQQQGAINVYLELEEKPSQAFLFPASDEVEEQAQLLQWLQQALEDPNKPSLGIILPSIAEEGEQLLRFLKRQLPHVAFNMSLGKPLNHYALVAQALIWLTLDGERLSNEQAKLLLYSPYLANAQGEFLGRAHCNDLPLLQERMIRLDLFTQAISRKAPSLAHLLNTLPLFPPQASIREWIDLFLLRLKHLGFPGDNSLDSHSYQCYQRLLALFDEFHSLQWVKTSLTQSEAIATLTELAGQTLFQSQTIESHVEILGWLEASGRRFNQLWILGITNDCLPQKTQPSAFIPIQLQRAYSMPRATPERELIIAQKQIKRFQLATDMIIFSYPRFKDDKPNLACSLLETLHPYLPLANVKTMKPSALITFDDAYQFPLLENELISGGSTLLANQAKCPFRAFAAHRLHLKPLPSCSDGFNALERGQLLHKTMELIWKNLKNQHSLLTSSEENLAAIVNESITQSLTPMMKQRHYSCSPIVLQVEFKRLKALAWALLAWDKERTAFVIDEIEKEYTYQLEQLKITLRIDRLDKTLTGEKWVIDYKTSLPSPLPWNEERPQTPQLLLYSLLDEEITALLFVSLKEGRLSCRGISSNTLALKGVSSLEKNATWDEARQQWKEQLQTLAIEISEGHCRPQPLLASLCAQCDFSSLCRFKA